MLSRIVTSSLAGICCADGCVHVIAESGRLLDARAGVRAHVNHELAGVNGGKEVLPEPRRQSQRSQRQTPGKESGKTPA